MRGGLVAEFESPAALIAAVRAVEAAGFRRFETYAPYPIEPLLTGPRPRTPAYALIFGLAGAATAYLIQWYTTAVAYPLNVGGLPVHPAPAFIPITFETTILFAAAAVFFGTLIHLGLPKLHDPLFDVAGFERASVDRFFLAISARDPAFSTRRLKELLAELGALRTERFGRWP